jgi:hypothetical protein
MSGSRVIRKVVTMVVIVVQASQGAFQRKGLANARDSRDRAREASIGSTPFLPLESSI